MEDIELKRKRLQTAVQESFDQAKFREIADRSGFEEQIAKQQELLEACKRKQRPSPDALGVERESCSLCQTTCEAYEPFEVFLLEVHERTYADSFIPTLCRHCKCPAYLHPPVQRPVSFPGELRRGLSAFPLKEDNLNFHGTLAVFQIINAELDDVYTLKSQEDELFLLVQHGGFKVICRSVKYFKEQQPLDKTFSLRRITVRETENPSLVLCVSSTSYTNSQAHFTKFMKACANMIPQGLRYTYSSVNSIKGLTDCAYFFPEVFSIKHVCALVMPEHSLIKETEPEDPIMSFFKTQKDILRGKKVTPRNKDSSKMSLGKIYDMMNFNGYQVQNVCNRQIQSQHELLSVLDKIIDEESSIHFLKLLLGKSDNYSIQALAAAKIGIPMVLTVNLFSLETFAFNSEKDCRELFRFFFPTLGRASRTLIVMRPLTVRSGLDTVLVDIFKCNHFVILKDIHRPLTTEEVMFLGKDYSFTGEGRSDYLDLMQESECRILVMSKIGAIEDAQIICNGCQYGRRRTEKKLLGVNDLYIRHEKEILNPFNFKHETEVGTHKVVESHFYRERVSNVHNLGENGVFSLNPFSSISELFDLDSIIENKIKSTELETDVPNYYLRQKELEKLREFSRQYNLAVHCSTPESAESEVLMFFPKLKEYSDVILIFKPEALNLRSDIEEFVQTLNGKIITTGSDGDEHYLHIAKQSARFEMEAAMQYSSFVIHPLGLHHLSSLFSLVSVPAEHQRILEIIDPNIAYFTGQSILRQQNHIQERILRYILLANSCEDTKPGSMRLLISSDEYTHVSFVVRNQLEEEREIRVRKLTYSNSAFDDRVEFTSQYERTKWFYEQIAKFHPSIIPKTYSYKIEPDDQDLAISRVFSSEEFKGEVFIEVVANMMKEHRHRETKTHEASRGSMTAFMWGRKLSLLVNKLESVKASIEDCGVVYMNAQEKFMGCIKTSNFWEVDRYKYMKCLDELKSTWSGHLSMEQADMIERTLVDILESPAFEEARSQANLSLVPEFLQLIDIRIFTKYEKAEELVSGVRFINQQEKAIAELKGQNTENIEVKDLAVVDVQPCRTHKRHTAANLMWLLKMYLPQQKHKHLGMNSSEYEIMLSSLYEGLVKNYKNDVGVKGISLLMLEYFLFSLWQAWKVHIAMVEIKMRIRNLHEVRDFASRYARTSSAAAEDADIEIEMLQKELRKWEKEYPLHLFHLTRIDIQYVSPEGLNPGFEFVPKERYFKHYALEYWEQEKYHPRYPNYSEINKFPYVSHPSNTVLGRPLPKVAEKWFNPPQFPTSNLRPVPREAYRNKGIMVKATKWVTHERLKQLIQQSILLLLNRGYQ